MVKHHVFTFIDTKIYSHDIRTFTFDLRSLSLTRIIIYEVANTFLSKIN